MRRKGLGNCKKDGVVREDGEWWLYCSPYFTVKLHSDKKQDKPSRRNPTFDSRGQAK